MPTRVMPALRAGGVFSFAACVVLAALIAHAERPPADGARCPACNRLRSVFAVGAAARRRMRLHARDWALARAAREAITGKPLRMQDGTFSSLLVAEGSATWLVLFYDAAACRSSCKAFLQALDRLADQLLKNETR